ncbi:SCO family protein [Putridiphycobacter roseus]|uniref:SCO family protein n=1 Tax=Putridiphycobacter roseus TaxID=2219161 RepID=A0A2W1NMY1_9FLAO|nr:SCO family protein [Putridiphycobacter roseus]PZE17032.1 SCO family protein [Putridiphycobacter roseus]
MKTRLILFILVLGVGVTIAGFMIKGKSKMQNSLEYRESIDNKLKVINPYDVNPKLVDSSVLAVRSGHTIAPFSLVNQYGEVITEKNTENKIYVANYFFTTCSSICPVMTTQLKRVQTEFPGEPWLKLLSHTVWPEGDSVSRLYNYALKYEAIPEQWWFLTGSKSDLYTMARKSYLVVPDENDPDYDHGNESDFIHTENFVLIDPKNQIRGMYDGTNPDEVSDLIKDIYDLKREFNF